MGREIQGPDPRHDLAADLAPPMSPAAMQGPVRIAVQGAVMQTMEGAVRAAVHGALGDAVRGAVWFPIQDALLEDLP